MDGLYSKKQILIVGAGNIGFRHFEGIIKSNLDFRISIVDPDPSKFARFQSHIKNNAREKLQINFYRNLDFESESISVAIVATNSNVRPKVLEDLCTKHKIEAIVFEKLISHSAKDLDAMEAMSFNQERAWVNYPRRIMDFYSNVSENLISRTSLDFKVEGLKWNLISNAPHFIDLVEFLTGSQLTTISHIELDNEMYETRPGFMDATGKMVFEFSDMSRLDLISMKKRDNTNAGVSISLNSRNVEVEINEQIGYAKGGLLKKEVHGKIEYQSELSMGIVDAIVLHGSSNLTTFRAAAHTHRIFITEVENYLRINRIYDLYHNKIT
jgi:predicted dehydrogenase